MKRTPRFTDTGRWPILGRYYSAAETDVAMTIAIARERLEDAEPAPQRERHCPHGEPASECNACLEASDFAYDAGREAAYFGGR